MPSRTSPLPVGLVAGQSGVVSWMERLNDAYNEGADAIIIPALVDGTDCTTMVQDIIAAAPEQSTLRFRDPGPVKCQSLGPGFIDKPLRILGAGGRFGTRLVPSVDTADAILDFDTPAVGDLWDIYGASVENLGFDLRSAPSATGIGTSAATGWFEADGIVMIGGDVCVRNAGTNSSFNRFRFIDPASGFFAVDGETGLELTLDHGDCTLYTGTIEAGIDVVCTTGTTKGALYIRRVVINADPATGDLHHALVVSSVVADLSVPIFATTLVADNCSGTPVKLVNVRNSIIALGWLNGAAGTESAIEYAGGGDHKIIGNIMFGGSAGTVEFTGSDSTTGVVSLGNTLPSEDVYKLTGAGKPTDLFLDDYIPGATADSQITNDLPNLVAGAGKTWGARDFKDHTHIQQDTVHLVGGGGEPAFTNSWANDAGSTAYFYRDSMDRVHLSGEIKSGTALAAFTLPAGYRPTLNKHFTGIHNDGTTVVLEVTSAGLVHLYDTFPAIAVSIDCSFLAGA